MGQEVKNLTCVMKIQLFLMIMTAAMILSCNTPADKTLNSQGSRDRTISSANSYSELFFDSLQLENFIRRERIGDSMALGIRNFYNQRNYQYAWFFKEGIADYAATFLNLQNDYM